MKDAAELIEKLGTPTEVAALVGRPIGTVASWKHRNAIPSEAWPAFIAAASSKRIKGVTADLLLAIHHRRTEPASAPSPSEQAA